MMRDKVEKMIETMDKVVEKTLHLVTPDSLKYMDSDNLEMLQLWVSLCWCNVLYGCILGIWFLFQCV